MAPKVKTGFEVPNGKFRPATHRNPPWEDIFELAKMNDVPYDSAQVVNQIKKAIDALNCPTPGHAQQRAAGEVYGLDPGADVAFYKK